QMVDRPLRRAMLRINAASPPSFNIERRSARSTLSLPAVGFRIACMRYRGFPAKLHHDVPNWVEVGALFHIRIVLDRQRPQPPLIEPLLGKSVLDSARFYHEKQRWFITLFVLMPDHLHALLSFPNDQSMSGVIGDWKHYHKH